MCADHLLGKLRVRNPRPESRLKMLAENFRMEGWTLTALGFVAGVCTTFSLVPQVMKAWRAADREAISKRTNAVASAAYALWIVHGVMLGATGEKPALLTGERAYGRAGLLSREGRRLAAWAALS